MPVLHLLSFGGKSLRTNVTFCAQFAGHLMFWLLFVLGSICTWGVLFYRGIESIPIQTLPLMVFWGMWIIVTVQSVTTVILYRRRGIGVEHYDR